MRGEGSDLIAADTPRVTTGERADGTPVESRTDLRIARALLAIALALVAIYGSDVARHIPVYGPLDEFFHVAYIENIVESGHPPILGRDVLVLGLGQKRPTPSAVVIRGLDHPYDSVQKRHVTPVFPDGTIFPQNEAIQAPLYYVVMTPVALVVPWSQRVLVIRLLGTLFVMIAVLFLYLAVRVVSPHRPLAAGIAAAILASMAGVVGMLSQVQNDALLLPLCVATFWLLARDLRSRRSGLLLPFVVGLSVVTQIVAGPAGVIAILAALRGDAALRAASWRSRAGARLIAMRGAAFVLPLIPWIAFNIHEYRWLWPTSRVSSGVAAPTTQNLGLWRHFPEYLYSAGVSIFNSFWVQLWPLQNNITIADGRPAAVIAAVAAVAIILASRSGQLVRERLRLGYWAAVAMVSFLGVFVVLLANAASVGGVPDFTARYFVAFAAAYAAFVGTAVACVGVGRAWIPRGVACAFSLVLMWEMLDLAYPWIVG